MINRRSISRARTVLAHLCATIGGSEPIPKATQEWGGANVVICNASYGGRYREVVTPYALEVSWMFEQIHDAFANLVDSCSKYELYGRLELAANATIGARADIGIGVLGNALLVEAEAMLGEMAAGHFEPLGLALGTSIAHDFSKERA
jgi:hypothetical protein